MSKSQPPSDGPHVPERSVYFDDFTEIMTLIQKCPGFTSKDSDFRFRTKGALVFFKFSNNVVQKIIEPEFENGKKPNNHKCLISRNFKKLKILKNGTVVVRGASDSVHAIYIAIAIYVNQHIPDEERVRQD